MKKWKRNWLNVIFLLPRSRICRCLPQHRRKKHSLQIAFCWVRRDSLPWMEATKYSSTGLGREGGGGSNSTKKAFKNWRYFTSTWALCGNFSSSYSSQFTSRYIALTSLFEFRNNNKVRLFISFAFLSSRRYRSGWRERSAKTVKRWPNVTRIETREDS